MSAPPSVNRILSRLRESAFFRSVVLLSGGSAAANLITFAALPVLTRLYSPADFSVLAVFSGVLSTLAVAACLRFDVAVAMPADDDDALNLVGLAVLSSCAVAALVGIVTVLFATTWRSLPRFEEIAGFLWLLPVGLLLSGLYLASQVFYVRKRAFRLLAGTRVGQSSLAAGVQLGCGVGGIAPLGLLFGQVLNTGAGAFVLLWRLIRTEQHMIQRLSFVRMRALITTYRRFPTLSTFEALANACGIFLPVILIGMLDAGPEAGYLTLAMNVIYAPMALIGSAITQVYLSHGPESHRQDSLARLTSDVLVGLFRTGAGPILFAGIVAPAFIGMVFGDSWNRTGVLIAWLTPSFLLQFLTVPISMALHITGRQGSALALQIFGLLFRSLAVVVVASTGKGWLAETYAISGIVFYGAYLVTILVATRVSIGDLLKARGVCAIPAAWAVAGLVVAGLGSLIR